MKLNEQYDITPLRIDPSDAPVEREKRMPGLDGWNEYGFAVVAEVGKEVEPALVRRMDNEVLRNLAAFAQANPNLDLSEVELVDGVKIPLDAASNDWSRYLATKEERAAAYASATRFDYTRGWYAWARIPNE